MPVLLVLCSAVDIVGIDACFDVGVVNRQCLGKKSCLEAQQPGVDKTASLPSRSPT